MSAAAFSICRLFHALTWVTVCIVVSRAKNLGCRQGVCKIFQCGVCGKRSLDPSSLELPYVKFLGHAPHAGTLGGSSAASSRRTMPAMRSNS